MGTQDIVVIVISRAKCTYALNVLSSVPHSCKVAHKCLTFSFTCSHSLISASQRAVTPQLLCPKTSLSPRNWLLPLLHTASLQGHVLSPAQSHQLTPATNSPQEAPGSWGSGKHKAREQEGICTCNQRGSLLPKSTTAVSSKESPELSTCGPPRPQVHPLTALPGPGPGVLIRCKAL